MKGRQWLSNQEIENSDGGAVLSECFRGLGRELLGTAEERQRHKVGILAEMTGWEAGCNYSAFGSIPARLSLIQPMVGFSPMYSIPPFLHDCVLILHMTC